MTAFAQEVAELPGACLIECEFTGDASWEFSCGDDVLRVSVEGSDVVVDRRRSGLVDFHPEFARETRASLPEGADRLTMFLDRCSLELLAGPLAVTHLTFPSEPYDTLRTSGSATARILGA